MRIQRGKNVMYWHILGVVVWAVALWGCGGPTEEGYAPEKQAASLEQAPVPDKAGPFVVGVKTITVIDTKRKTNEFPEGRPLVIDIWYPAVPPKEGTPKDAYDVSKDSPPATQEVIKQTGIAIPNLAQEAYRDAELYRKGGPYPLILYSHGSGGIRFQSVFQCPHLASHGYIVVSPDHVNNTLYDILAGKDARDSGILLQSADDRPKDMVFVYEEMKRRNQDAQDTFSGMIKPEQVGITGHSFGGFTSILTPRDLPELKVSIPQAPFTSLFTGLGVQPRHLKDLPIMVLAAKKDLTLDYGDEQRGFYEKMIEGEWFGAAPRYLVTLERGGHFTYSNICDLDIAPLATRFGFSAPEKLIEDGCSETGNVPPAEGHRLTNHYATALFNAILRDSPKSRDFLKQLESSEVTFESKMP